MKKILYFGLLILLSVSCKDINYKPSKFNKAPNAPIEEYFDTIYNIPPTVKLVSFDDDCNCINAIYTDSVLQLEMYVCKVSDSINAKEKFKNYIYPLFDSFKKKKNYKNYDLFAKDDKYFFVAWRNDNFLYYAKINQETQDILSWTSYFRLN